jgi:hypothetical protein
MMRPRWPLTLIRPLSGNSRNNLLSPSGGGEGKGEGVTGRALLQHPTLPAAPLLDIERQGAVVLLGSLV